MLRKEFRFPKAFIRLLSHVTRHVQYVLLCFLTPTMTQSHKVRRVDVTALDQVLGVTKYLLRAGNLAYFYGL